MKNGSRVRFATPLGTALIVTAVLPLTATSPTFAQNPTFADVMRRAHEYVLTYHDHELSTVISRERYEQRWLDATGSTKAERLLISDFMLFQLPPDETWFALRDVYEVDGKPIENRAARLNELFSRPRDSKGALGLEIAKESGRFNLAADVYYRTINVPTFGLLYLLPMHRMRMAFKKIGEEPVDGIDAWIVEYEETKGPTLVGTPNGRDLQSHGRFWIEPTTGAVLRTEMVLGGTRALPSRVTLTVTYRDQPALGFRVPIEMLERYDTPRRPLETDVVVAHATYTEFRRFDWRTLVPPLKGR